MVSFWIYSESWVNKIVVSLDDGFERNQGWLQKFESVVLKEWKVQVEQTGREDLELIPGHNEFDMCIWNLSDLKSVYYFYLNLAYLLDHHSIILIEFPSSILVSLQSHTITLLVMYIDSFKII